MVCCQNSGKAPWPTAILQSAVIVNQAYAWTRIVSHCGLTYSLCARTQFWTQKVQPWTTSDTFYQQNNFWWTPKSPSKEDHIVMSPCTTSDPGIQQAKRNLVRTQISEQKKTNLCITLHRLRCLASKKDSNSFSTGDAVLCPSQWSRLIAIWTMEKKRQFLKKTIFATQPRAGFYAEHGRMHLQLLNLITNWTKWLASLHQKGEEANLGHWKLGPQNMLFRESGMTCHSLADDMDNCHSFSVYWYCSWSLKTSTDNWPSWLLISVSASKAKHCTP